MSHLMGLAVAFARAWVGSLRAPPWLSALLALACAAYCALKIRRIYLAGYANRFINLKFPELAEDDDEIWVTIRNPKLIPPGELRDPQDKTDPEASGEEAVASSYKLFAKIVVAWRVYDATSIEDEQPLLSLPATPELIAKLPLVILNKIGEEFSKINPQ